MLASHCDCSLSINDAFQTGVRHANFAEAFGLMTGPMLMLELGDCASGGAIVA